MAPLIEAGAALVGAGVGGGGLANELSANVKPNTATNTNTEHAPMIFFIP